MKIGTLEFTPITGKQQLVCEPTRQAITDNKLDVLVAKIDPNFSDTAAFCEAYQTGTEIAVNCVILEAKRGEDKWYAACMIPATERADINGVVRKALDAKKVSFAPREDAVSMSGMEFGAINPIGLPADWRILVDSEAATLDYIVIGSGLRGSKLLVSGKLLSSLPNAEVLNLAKS